MDEIGFIVNYIEESGYIRTAPIGGINYIAASFGEVVSENGVRGVLVPEAGTAAGDINGEKVCIDIGAKNKKEAERKVKIGDFFVVAPYAKRLAGSRVFGRPFDECNEDQQFACRMYYKTMISEAEPRTYNQK